MKRSEQDQLLREILNDDAANFRAASLADGLAFLQQRQRRKRMAQTGATLLLPAAVLMTLVLHLAPAPPVVRRVSASPADSSKVKIISDEELFALFPNRAMALIGPRGHQQLVFLDHGAAGEQP